MARMIGFSPEVEGRLDEWAARHGGDPDRFVNEAVDEKLRNGVCGTEEAPTRERPGPNLGMLEALRKTREIQQGMSPKPDAKSAVEWVREARSGAMCGDDPSE